MVARALARFLSAFGVLLLVGAVSSCTGASLTELVLVVELGDGLSVPEDLSYLTIRVDTLSGRLVRETVPFTGPDARTFPLTLGLRQASNLPDSVEIVVEGFANGMTPSLSRRVLTHFLPNDRRVVHVVLTRDCYDVLCDSGLTCLRGACVDPTLEPSTLPHYTGTLPDAGPMSGLDAGMDATVIVDAAPSLDAATRDAPRAADAGPDAPSCRGDAGLVGEPAGCLLSRPPARPTCGFDGDDGFVRTFALLDPVIDQSSGVWARSSFDLDGYCTTPVVMGSPQECEAASGDPVQPDGPGGVDNVIGQSIYVSVLTFFPNFQDETNESARRGRSVPILRISGWNGEANDAHVTLAIAAAVDVLPEGTSVPAGGLDFDNGLPEPRWDGTDTAYAGANYFAAGDERFPLLGDDNAYVADYTLVARLPDRGPIDIPAPHGVGRVRLTEPIAVIDLAPDGLSVSNARLSGRWAFTDMLDHLDDLGVCAGTPGADMYLAAFSLLTQRVMDVRSVPGTGGAGVSCDAASATLPFGDAAAVRWGGIVPVTLEPPTCP